MKKIDTIDTIQNRLAEGLRIREMTAAELSRKTGISKSNISHYMKGMVEPKQDRIYLIASALRCDPSWLIGYDVPFERVVSVEMRDINEDDQLRKIVKLWGELSQDDRDLIESLVSKFI